MYSEINKDNLSPIDKDIEENKNHIDDEKESKINSIIESGDSFINTFSVIFETFMWVMNWIMKNAYLIAVLIIAILFIFKLNK